MTWNHYCSIGKRILSFTMKKKSSRWEYTVWKLQTFSATQISREINVGVESQILPFSHFRFFLNFCTF